MTATPSRWRLATARLCRVASVASLTAVTILAVTTVAGGSAGAVPTAGVAEVVTPQDGSPGAGAALTGGSGRTSFSLKLHAGAACGGDSSNGGYRVQSFMVPRNVDPAGLTFGARGPLPSGVGGAFRQPLFAVNTTSFANAPTNLADRPGGPGVIINVPSFDFGVFSAADLPAGAYTVGIACTKGPPSRTQLERFWAAPMNIGAPADPGVVHVWEAPATRPPAAADPAPGDPTSPSPEPEPGPPATPVPAAADVAAAPVVLDAAGEPAAATPSTSTGPTSGAGGAGGRVDAYGGAPTAPLPVAAMASHLSIHGNRSASLALWAALAIVTARIAVLLVRPPAVASP